MRGRCVCVDVQLWRGNGGPVNVTLSVLTSTDDCGIRGTLDGNGVIIGVTGAS